jgi:hypothetical protein
MRKSVIGFVGFLLVLANSILFITAQAANNPKSITTVSALKNAQWNPTVKLTYSMSSVIMQPNGIPNHSRDTYYAVPKAGVIVPDATSANIIADPTKAQTYKFTIPTNPKYANVVTATSLGSIGVMVSGAVLYNPFEGDGKTVAMANNFTITNGAGITASFVDKCAGHPTPDIGAYHYHGLPNCVTAKVDKVGKASHIIGFALDGFPIYGDRDIKGKQITAKNLDQCNGISSATPEFPKGIYHYVLLGTADARSSIACFHGEVDASQIQAMPPMAGGQMPMPDIAAAAKKLNITEDELKSAFGTTMPPDLASAAKKLGVTEAVLLNALGIQAKGRG